MTGCGPSRSGWVMKVVVAPSRVGMSSCRSIMRPVPCLASPIFHLPAPLRPNKPCAQRVGREEKTMIGYALLGSNDLEKAKAFYDVVLAELGAKRTMGGDTMQGYGSADDGPMLGVCKPYDGRPATSGNGTMIALAAASREAVDKAHAAALAQGGRDEGAP